MEEVDTARQAERVTKDQVKRFRASADDVKKIEDKVALSGLSFSEYCRRAALEKEITAVVPAELRLAILTVGNDLHQLARIANAGKLPGAGIAELNEVVAQLLAKLR